MDPITGVIVLVLAVVLWYALRAGWGALREASGRASRAGAEKAGAKSAQLRASTSRAAGEAMRAGRAAVARGAAAGARAVRDGAGRGFTEASKASRSWVDAASSRRAGKAAGDSDPSPPAGEAGSSQPDDDRPASTPAAETVAVDEPQGDGPPPPDGARCDWGSGGTLHCQQAGRFYDTTGTVAGRYCDQHALDMAAAVRNIAGVAPAWEPTPTYPTTEPVGETVSAPAIPTGEIQGKADTERALQAYRGVVTTYLDDLAAMNTQAQQTETMASRLYDQLAAAELGDSTLPAMAAVHEDAASLARLTEELGPAGEAVLADLSVFDAAVAAHDTVEAAAVANTDGGTTDFHSDGTGDAGVMTHRNVNNVR